MLSVGESAQRLGVSPSRVRALIKEGRLPAAKNGREWVLREEDVLQRIMASPRGGAAWGCEWCGEDAFAIVCGRSSRGAAL